MMMKAKRTYGEEPLMMMIDGWTAASEKVRCHLLLLKMGKKGDRCRRAAVNEDWRGSPKPWAVEEIVVAVKIAINKKGSRDREHWGKRRSED